ncbi:MAG: hypothetical protein RJA42_693 [Bacteroidota bacterium]
MKFLVASNILLKQLSAINGVVASNPIIPILENSGIRGQYLDFNGIRLTNGDDDAFRSRRIRERIDRFTSAFIVRNPTKLTGATGNDLSRSSDFRGRNLYPKRSFQAFR